MSSWKLQCDTVSHIVTPLHLYMRVFITEVTGLVGVPGLCYTTDAGPSLGLFLPISVIETCSPGFTGLTPPPHASADHKWGGQWGMGQHLTLVLGLSGYRVSQPASSPLSSPPR